MTIAGMCATEVVIRQGSSLDRERVGEFLAGLSVTTRQRRFFNSLPYAGPALIRTMAVAEPGKLVLLALDGEVVVGHGMAVWSSARTADFAIVVTDAYQHRGTGCGARTRAGRARARGKAGEIATSAPVRSPSRGGANVERRKGR